MKTFMKTMGIVLYAAGWSAMILAGAATIMVVREHSDMIGDMNERLCDVRNRVSRMEDPKGYYD